MMRPASLYSIQSVVDPYRNRRRSSTKDGEDSPTTPKSTTQLIFKPPIIAATEPGRTHSYLPYSNHAPDFKQAKAELYVDEDEDTQSTHFQVVDMINGIVVQPHPPLDADRRCSSTNISLTDKVRYQRRQKKQQENTHFNTAYSKRLFIAFVVLVALAGLALIVYFCWPRVPKVIIKSAKLERVGEPADWGPTQQPWLRAAWRMNVTIDNTVNFVPTHIHRVEWTLRDRDTNVPFAWSTTDATRFQPYSDTLLRVDFRVNYESPSVNDTTFKNLYNACGPQIPTETPALNVTMQAVVYITGLAWSNTLYVHPPVGEGLYCPFN